MLSELKVHYVQYHKKRNKKVRKKYEKLGYSKGTSIHHIVFRRDGGSHSYNNLVEMYHEDHKKVHVLFDNGKKAEAQKIVDKYIAVKQAGDRLEDNGVILSVNGKYVSKKCRY